MQGQIGGWGVVGRIPAAAKRNLRAGKPARLISGNTSLNWSPFLALRHFPSLFLVCVASDFVGVCDWVAPSSPDASRWVEQAAEMTPAALVSAWRDQPMLADPTVLRTGRQSGQNPNPSPSERENPCGRCRGASRLSTLLQHAIVCSRGNGRPLRGLLKRKSPGDPPEPRAVRSRLFTCET